MPQTRPAAHSRETRRVVAGSFFQASHGMVAARNRVQNSRKTLKAAERMGCMGLEANGRRDALADAWLLNGGGPSPPSAAGSVARRRMRWFLEGNSAPGATCREVHGL